MTPLSQRNQSHEKERLINIKGRRGGSDDNMQMLMMRVLMTVESITIMMLTALVLCSLGRVLGPENGPLCASASSSAN